MTTATIVQFFPLLKRQLFTHLHGRVKPHTTFLMKILILWNFMSAFRKIMTPRNLTATASTLFSGFIPTNLTRLRRNNPALPFYTKRNSFALYCTKARRGAQAGKLHKNNQQIQKLLCKTEKLKKPLDKSPKVCYNIIRRMKEVRRASA